MRNKQSSLSTDASTINIGIPIYEAVDSMDVLGAFQVFHVTGSPLNPFLITENGRPITSLEDVGIIPNYSFRNCPRIDVLFVPGAAGYTNGLPTPTKQTPFEKMIYGNNDNAYLDFLKLKAKEAKWVTGVCTGAILMAAAGLLDGKEVTTHWAFKDVLALFPKVTVVPGYPRYHQDGNVITGGGITSTLDCGFYISQVVTGNEQAVDNTRLTIQYAPQETAGGDPTTATQETMDEVTAHMSTILEKTTEQVENFLG